MAPSVIEIYNAAAAAGARPDPLLLVSEWADQYRSLSPLASAEPGPWRTERTPYLAEIMDCLSPSSTVERVVLMAGAQIGKTECGNNWIGYIIHHAPGPMMAVQPTVEMARRNSKQRIDPLIEASDVLRNLVATPRSRDSGNTMLAKEFPGGILVMTGANSAAGLRSMAARYLFLDEIDAYPGDVDGEGDPVNLAIARTRTFARRKIFMVSTPKITGRSRIESVFAESDQRWYWVPCPTCHEYQVLRFPSSERFQTAREFRDALDRSCCASDASPLQPAVRFSVVSESLPQIVLTGVLTFVALTIVFFTYLKLIRYMI